MQPSNYQKACCTLALNFDPSRRNNLLASLIILPAHDATTIDTGNIFLATRCSHISHFRKQADAKARTLLSQWPLMIPTKCIRSCSHLLLISSLNIVLVYEHFQFGSAEERPCCKAIFTWDGQEKRKRNAGRGSDATSGQPRWSKLGTAFVLNNPLAPN